MMDLPQVLQLMRIEKECVERNSYHVCDRQCESCDLVQEDSDIIEAYQTVELILEQMIREGSLWI
jgi:hypothetical protein